MAVIVLIIWAIGFMAYKSPDIIHALPVVAIVLILVSIFRRTKRI